MSNNALKDPSLTTDEKEKITVVSISIALSAICLITAFSILPERCSLFSDNVTGGLQCDVLTIPYVPCGCQDRRTASVATIIAGMGLSFIFIPLLVYAIRNWQNSSVEQTKLFD